MAQQNQQNQQQGGRRGESQDVDSTISSQKDFSSSQGKGSPSSSTSGSQWSQQDDKVGQKTGMKNQTDSASTSRQAPSTSRK